MKRLFVLLALIVASAIPLAAQHGNTLTIPFAGVPSGSCAFMQLASDTVNGNNYFCNPLTHAWVQAGAGGTGTVTVVAAGSLTSTAIVTGGGAQALQTPSATSTLSAAGALSLAAGGSLKSADTGTPGFTFATNSIAANQTVNFAAGKGISSSDTGAPSLLFGTNLITLNQPLSAAGIPVPGVIGGTTPAAGHFTTLDATGGVTATADGTHPGNAAFAGNTTVVTPAANTFNLMGPATATFTAYALQFPNAAPAANTILCTGAPSSAVSQATYCNSVTNLTLVTPALGTPSALVLTNATGLPAAQVPPVPTLTNTCAVGAAHTLTGPFEVFQGSTATDCYVQPPTPVAGYEFCIGSDTNVSTKIHLKALGGSASYELIDRTGLGTAGTGTVDTATGTVTNQICIQGLSTTVYRIMNKVGDFANN